MPKYQYSIIRFVPSPIRGEFVNLGLIVGCDQTGEWLIDVVSSKNRATKLDDQSILPMVVADLQRVQTLVENFSEPDIFGTEVELSEEWLRQLSRNSQNVLQFSTPKSVLGDSASNALQKLWGNLIVEHVPAERSNVSKATVISRYWTALTQQRLTAKNLKRKVRLETSKTHAPIDVVVHNGVVKDITQCWSFQIKETDDLLNDIKAWGWTIRDLRESGGMILTPNSKIEVPNDVNVGVLFAPGASGSFLQEAQDVFSDADVRAEQVELVNVDSHAEAAAKRLAAA